MTAGLPPPATAQRCPSPRPLCCPRSPILQGWAIVDNTVGEDWDNVELSLVAGAPQSFIENLSQPFYARRPVVAMHESAMLTPQTHESTILGGGGGGGD